MRLFISTLILGLFIFDSVKSFSQISYGRKVNDILEAVADDLDSARHGSNKVNDYKFNASNEKRVLAFLKKYENDPSLQVRARVEMMKAGVAYSSTTPEVRQEVVEYLLQNSTLPDAGMRQYAVDRLLDFKEEDFSPRAKAIINHTFDKV